ncbi:4,5-DOPA-extradiol-dioxygenase [Pectinatus haikarae]|uniref:4,5-DOPA-extradiol-dioxygenase n=1 Tax=Pectinatus haikarae TaxID=349096 RepID=UPI0018C7D59A|nr:4,5-DOPA dioxygenase extradiol [Pectinatus haikarae]
MGKMPVLFVGHGSPMNAIEDNEFSLRWHSLPELIPEPKAILSISAHWYTDGTRISTAAEPKTIYDMYGFPKELYEVRYPVKGAPELARHTGGIISAAVAEDNTWGIDHGTWSVLHRMYPKADIPVYQLSVDKNASPEQHMQIGKELASLRDDGVLIFASGNVVHNLALVDWEMPGGHSWAKIFDSFIKQKIAAKEYKAVLDYKQAGESARLAFFSPDHFYPLLYTIGASANEDKLTVFNEGCTLGALSMTSYLWG